MFINPCYEVFSVRALLRLEDGVVVIYEEHAGTRGGDYFYVERPEGLVHLYRLYGRYATLRYESRKGRRKSYVYRIPLAQIEGETLYYFGFTNSGGFYFGGRYRVVGGRIVKEDVDKLSLKSLNFAPLGRKLPILKEYEAVSYTHLTLPTTERV